MGKPAFCNVILPSFSDPFCTPTPFLSETNFFSDTFSRFSGTTSTCVAFAFKRAFFWTKRVHTADLKIHLKNWEKLQTFVFDLLACLIYRYHMFRGVFNKCTGKSTGILPVLNGNLAGARRRCFFGLSEPVQHRRPVLSGASLLRPPFLLRTPI